MDPSIQICSNCGKAGQEVSNKCSQCKAAYYCDKACQAEGWKANHRRLCKQLNVSDAQQIHHPDHSRVEERQQLVYAAMSASPLHVQQIYRVFLSGDDSVATHAKMKQLLMKEPMWARHMLMLQSLHILMQLPKEVALKCTLPLLLAFDCGCDPNYWSRPPPTELRDDGGSTALHWLSEMAHPKKHSSHQAQAALGRQLLGAGANVNAITDIGLGNVTPLHRACHSGAVTNLSFIRLLLENGANPNAPSAPQGETPLMHTLECAMPAAKLLFTFPSIAPIDVNVRSANGSTFLGGVCASASKLKLCLAMGPPSSQKAKIKLMLKQLNQVEEILVGKAAEDGGWIDARGAPDKDFQSSGDKNEEPFSDKVDMLFDKDLMEDGPIWHKETPFWVDDALSAQLELFHKKDHLHTGFNNGAYSETNKKAAVGQGIQIIVKLPNTNGDHFGHLSGAARNVFEEPMEEELQNSDSHFYGKVSSTPNINAASSLHSHMFILSFCWKELRL